MHKFLVGFFNLYLNRGIENIINSGLFIQATFVETKAVAKEIFFGFISPILITYLVTLFMPVVTSVNIFGYDVIKFAITSFIMTQINKYIYLPLVQKFIFKNTGNYKRLEQLTTFSSKMHGLVSLEPIFSYANLLVSFKLTDIYKIGHLFNDVRYSHFFRKLLIDTDNLNETIAPMQIIKMIKEINEEKWKLIINHIDLPKRRAAYDLLQLNSILVRLLKKEENSLVNEKINMLRL
jgi:hypothetical protein